MDMAPTVALVLLILQITSSRCRNIGATNKHLNFTNDDATADVAEHFVPDSLEDHQDQFNELKKYLKVIPFKENGDLKNSTTFLRDEKDYPVAVILASHLEENMRDNLKRININDYLTKIIKNSYKFGKNKNVKIKTEKHSEVVIDKGEDEETLQPDESKLDVVKLRPTIVSNYDLTDLGSTTSDSDMDIKNILNNINIKLKDTKLNKSMEDGGRINTNSNDVTPDNHSHKSVSNTKGIRKLDETKVDDHKTLQEDDHLTMNDLIESINLDEHTEQSDTDGNHSINEIEITSPDRQMILSCKEFNVTGEDFIPPYYSLKFVFNL